MKEILIQLFTNDILIAALISSFLAQLMKVIITHPEGKKFQWNLFFSSGGNPSSHTSSMTTLTILVGARYGFNSAYFAIAFIVSGIIIVDALSVRREVGEHSKTLNEIFADKILGKRLQEIVDVKVFRELIGHTVFEVFTGFLLGILIAVLDLIIVSK
jgi:acid phosphatase family membrane protein YuiD